MGELQNTPEKTSEENADAKPVLETRRPAWKRYPAIAAGVAALAGLFYLGLHYLVFSFTHESTDNAFLESDVVAIAPKVAGQVRFVQVSDNQTVKAADLLVEIDPRDLQMVLAQKKAALVSAGENTKLLEASFEMLGTQVATAQATAKQSEAEAVADQAKADQAGADLKRAEDLAGKKIISPQEFDAAKAAADSAKATYKAGQEKAASDRSKIVEAQAQYDAGRRAWDRAQAQANQSQVDVQQAELNLSYAHVTAPAEGRIARKAVESGDYVQAGQKLMALVLNDVWVTANFKEAQLQNIRTNQPVKIAVDSVGGRVFFGRVQSIQAGSGAAFSLLPPENAVGNYVKVVQRVPVKIVFDKPIEVEQVLGPGMSVVPAVRVSNFEVPAFVIAIVATVVALAVGFFWVRAANRGNTSP